MPPYPEIPYGAAPAWCFPLFEYSVYILLAWCLLTAVKKGPRDVLYLLGGLAFGLLLEYMEVMMGSYTYGRFWLMLGRAPLDIPFCIGVGWGIIMYSARLFTNRFGLSIWAAAAFDTLLALNIDLSMDVVAYRTHMWHWYWTAAGQNPLTMQWFGIPYGNFVGWQTVVFCYSGFSRTFERYLMRKSTGAFKFILVAVLALLCSLAVLYVTERIWPLLTKIGILSVHRFAGISVILASMVAFAWRRKTVSPGSLPAIAWAVPGAFHLLFFGCFFIFGFYLENKWMTIAAVVNLLVGLGLHLFPFVGDRSISDSIVKSLSPLLTTNESENAS